MGARHLRLWAALAFLTLAAACSGGDGAPSPTTTSTGLDTELRQLYVGRPGSGLVRLSGLDTLAVPGDAAVYGTATWQGDDLVGYELAVVGSDDRVVVFRGGGDDVQPCLDAAAISVTVGDVEGCAIRALGGLRDGPDSWLVGWHDEGFVHEVTADRRLDDLVAWVESWRMLGPGDDAGAPSWEIVGGDFTVSDATPAPPSPVPFVLASLVDGATGTFQAVAVDDGSETATFFDSVDYRSAAVTATAIVDDGWSCPSNAPSVPIRGVPGCSAADPDVAGRHEVAWAEEGLIFTVAADMEVDELIARVERWERFPAPRR